MTTSGVEGNPKMSWRRELNHGVDDRETSESPAVLPPQKLKLRGRDVPRSTSGGVFLQGHSDIIKTEVAPFEIRPRSGYGHHTFKQGQENVSAAHGTQAVHPMDDRVLFTSKSTSLKSTHNHK